MLDGNVYYIIHFTLQHIGNPAAALYRNKRQLILFTHLFQQHFMGVSLSRSLFLLQ